MYATNRNHRFVPRDEDSFKEAWGKGSLILFTMLKGILVLVSSP